MSDFEPQQFVRIHGAVHRCTLRYSSIKALDPLLQFLYDALAYESKISSLRASFGLPVRLIEDSLAELIKRNLAALDVRGGRIVRIADAVMAPAHRFRTERFFWQDQLSGAILSTWVAQRYQGRQPEGVTLSTQTAIVDFGDLPDGQLIPAIQRIQPELAFDQDREWGLDRVVDRVRIRPLSIWVPVKTIRAGTSITHFIDAPEVPPWLSRSWAATYQQTLAAAGDERSPIVLTSLSVEAADEPGLDYQTAAWSQAALNALTVAPRPESRYDLRELRQRTAKAQLCLQSLTTTELITPSPELSHLDEALRRAQSLVVISMSVLDVAVGKRLRGIFASQTAGWQFDLCLLVGSVRSEDERQRLDSLRPVLKAHFPSRLSIIDEATPPGLQADFVLVDGEEAWIGASESLVSRRPALHLSGAETVRSLFSLVERHLPESSQGRFWLQHHRSAIGRVGPSNVRPFAGELASESVSDVIRRVDEIWQLVAYGVEKPDLLASALGELEEPTAQAPKGNRDERKSSDLRSGTDAELGSLQQQWPRLFERYLSLAQALRSPLPARYGTVSFVGLVEETMFIERLIDKRPNAGDTIRVLVRQFSPTVLSDIRLQLLKRALEQHWPVHLGFTEAEGLDHREARNLLQERVRDSRIQIYLLREAPPCSVVSIGAITLVTTRPWLDEPEPDSPESVAAFATSAAFASGVERLFKDLARSP